MTGYKISSMNPLNIALGISCVFVILGGLGSIHYALETNGWGIITSIGASFIGVIGIAVSCWADSKLNPKQQNKSVNNEATE